MAQTNQSVDIPQLDAKLASLIEERATQARQLSHLLSEKELKQIAAETSTPPKKAGEQDVNTKASTSETPADVDIEATLSAADEIIKKHIGLLHDYNEIKDTAQGLLGLIAEARGVRVVDLYAEFGLCEKD